MRRFAATFALLIFSTVLASAQTKMVWQIGNFDQSSMEFKAHPHDHVSYQVGKSDPARDWPGMQRTGSSYEIQFHLNTPPRGVFSLKASILTSPPRIPALQVQINTHTGTYYLHPKILYTAGLLHRSPAQITIEIPADYLHVGQNNLILSCVNTPPAQGEPSSTLPSAIGYDAIAFSNNPSAKYNGRAIRADVKPTIFYRRKAGNLVEIVTAFLRFGGATPAGRAILTIHGERYTAQVAALKDSGEERVAFEIPAWEGTIPGRLEVAAGKKASFQVSLAAARKWTLFVVPHTHLDVGFTDYQGKVAEIHARTLQEAANLIHQHPDFRFTTDGSWNVQQFLATRSKERQNDLFKLAQEDKIGIPADYANLLTGYASLETLYRSLYYSKWLSRTYGVPFTYATTTDVPSYTGAYPSILASAGIKYWAVGGNGDRAPILVGHWDEKSPFWWEGPDGQKVLFWYSNGYGQIDSLFGLPPQQAAVYDSLPIFLQKYSSPSYKPDVALIYGAQYENTDLYPGIATFATAWNQTYAYPKLQYATFPDFFRYVDQHYGKDLPTYKGDMGPYWEDGIGSDAYYAAEDRKNQSGVLSAEIASTVTHVLNPNLHPPKLELEDAWNNIILFAEHTWTAWDSISQPDSEEATKQLAVKDNRATQAAFDVEDLSNRAMAQLANQIHIPAGTLVVFNALNWQRDALMETDLDENQELVDLTTQKIVPMEILSNKDKLVHVRFLATDLPAVGYKCYQIRSTPDSKPGEPAITNNPVIENQYYRITVDPQSGSIKSIFDKQLQRELVNNNSPYKFGQYLYVTGGDGQTRMVHPNKSLPLGQLTIHPATSGAYLGTQETPWGDSIRLRSSDVNTPAINLEVLLFNHQKKIEFRYSVQKDYTTAKEGVYFAFPIATVHPQFEYATQQGWVNPAKDMFKGASLEWFSIQKWMAAYDADFAVGIVPVDASLASFGDINRGEWPVEFHPKTSTIFSYIMNNYWHTNYRAGQGGAFTFRYVLTSAAHLDPASLSRLGWASMERPELDHVISNDKAGDPKAPLSAEGTSFLQISSPNIVLVDWKLAEDGNGTILRLKETAGQAGETTVRLLHSTVLSASLCDAMEDKLQDLKVSGGNQITVAFHPHAVMTVRLNIGSKH